MISIRSPGGIRVFLATVAMSTAFRQFLLGSINPSRLGVAIRSYSKEIHSPPDGVVAVYKPVSIFASG